MNWTEGRIKSFITTGLRQMSRRWPPKYEAKEEAYVGTKVNTLTGRLAKHYRCASCRQEWPGSQVEVDHIESVVPASGFTTWDDYIRRLFCSKSNFQILCKTCHKVKSKVERKPL